MFKSQKSIKVFNDKLGSLKLFVDGVDGTYFKNNFYDKTLAVDEEGQYMLFKLDAMYWYLSSTERIKKLVLEKLKENEQLKCNHCDNIFIPHPKLKHYIKKGDIICVNCYWKNQRPEKCLL